MVGARGIDRRRLGTERLDLGFQTKPREGLGLSVGGIINSLFRVRGALARPAIEIDPAGTAKKTGFAFATGGLSIVAKSLFDRLSAEADMCRKLPRTRQLWSFWPDSQATSTWISFRRRNQGVNGAS